MNKYKEKLRILSPIRDQRTEKQGNKGTGEQERSPIPADILVDI